MLCHLSFLSLLPLLVNAQDSSLATVPWRTGNAKVDSLIERLTPEDKVSLVHGSVDIPGNQQQAGYVVPVPRLGIPAVRLTDGEAGVNVVHNATAVPMQLNVAATWSKSAAYNSGYVPGREAKILGMDVLLAPRVNILRDPVAGNFWQSYSEDPFLNAQLGVQALTAIQNQGTMGNPKQIGPSSTGASSGDLNSIVDMQTLQEVYWSAIGALLEAGGATLMCSYARINGVPACQYQPLFDTVRDMYNSSAIVMSDWTATHSTRDSVVAGLDWEMPLGEYLGEPLYDSVYITKNLSETYVNRQLGHILSKYDAFGLLDGNQTAVNAPGPIPGDVKLANAIVAYDIAVKSGVLLKNDNRALPLSANASIAVIGPNGVQYSHGTNFAERALGFPDREISPLDALKNRTGSDIPSAVGTDQEGTLIPASALRNLNGTQGLSRNDSMDGTAVDEQIDFGIATALPANRTYQWQGYLDAPTAGLYTISFQRKIPSSEGKTNLDYGQTFAIGTLSINGSEVAAGYRLLGDGGVKPWSNSIATRDGWDNIKSTVYLSAGWHNISATIIGLLQQPVSVRLCWVTPEQRESNIQAAVSVAKSVDTPVVFAFANSPAQIAMTLDDGMDELCTRIAAANPKTIVVLQNSEPVTMPWLPSVSAVLEMMYPGQEGSWAIADLLLGNRSPQGRLPVTYPTAVNASLTRNPAYPGRVNTADGNATFDEGVNIGYRWYKATNTPVLFPFGYGLTYTSFEYSALRISSPNGGHGWQRRWNRPSHGWSHGNADEHSEASASPHDENVVFSVSFTITNTGSVAGIEVPQVYIGPPADADSTYSGVQFAAITLVGFDNIEIESRESAGVHIGIPRKQLSFYDTTNGSWVLAAGNREVWIGKSAEDIVLTGTVKI
ncbi:hypothetical protein LTR56_026282 [Elasticomyces elasticus]|nr:hypothetical protein LTR56_026282 [Elasticomyces elasticus]KAK3626755.1 hypothetical protein LTR22_023050 [Elasticomyces elasticus]KAK4922057.1 hypothetical protein LTR49_010643 [Elasticomyces elasticus]KAK5747791.1 hypothetical protein LTS12_022146 [Elasticomyces elasticus]